jgi:hydrogenase maturation protease
MGVSSHSFDLAEAIELARTLGSLPEYTVIYGIEGQRFGSGEELSPEVVRAAEAVIQIIMARSGHPGTSPQTADRP